MFSTKNFLGVHWDQVPPWKIQLLLSALFFAIAIAEVVAGFLFSVFFLDWVMLVGSWGAIMGGWSFLFGSLTSRDKWLKKKEAKPASLPVFYALTIAWAIFSMFVAASWAVDRLGLVRVAIYHERVGGLNPLICVNDTPTQGFTAPYPETLSVKDTEILSIEICPHPLNVYALKVDGLRFRGEDHLGTTRLDFAPPLRIKPGEEIEITVIGQERSFYRQVNSPLYVLKRYLPYSQEEIKSLLTRGADEPGYNGLDWERMEKEGLFYLDHSSDPNTRRVDAIYATYAGDSDLDAWSARFPRGYEIVKIPFSFCIKPENDTILMGSMQNLPLWKRGIIVTIEKDGTVLVRDLEDRTILFVCANDYWPSTSN